MRLNFLQVCPRYSACSQIKRPQPQAARSVPIREQRLTSGGRAHDAYLQLQVIFAHPGSRYQFARSKGLTEDGLASLGYEVIAFHPGFLANAQRPYREMDETIVA